jgi:hypothetical protein
MGLQYKTVEQAEKEFQLPVQQLLGLFNKAIRKLVVGLNGGEILAANNNDNAMVNTTDDVDQSLLDEKDEDNNNQMEDVTMITGNSEQQLPQVGQIISLKRSVHDDNVVNSSNDKDNNNERWVGRIKKHKRR